MPSFVGRQTGISLKGEVSNHKGNFDEKYPGRHTAGPALPAVSELFQAFIAYNEAASAVAMKEAPDEAGRDNAQCIVAVAVRKAASPPTAAAGRYMVPAGGTAR
jgi:hypothetical protein